MRITITIDCHGDAFHPYPGPEAGRILRNLALGLESSPVMGILRKHELLDVYGTTVGDYEVTE